MQVELVCIAKDYGTNDGEDDRGDQVNQLILGLARSAALRYPHRHLVRESTANDENGNGRHNLGQVAQASQLERYSVMSFKLAIVVSSLY